MPTFLYFFEILEISPFGDYYRFLYEPSRYYPYRA
jgi:hypothetical protein